MKVTSVKIYPVKSESSSVRANGSLVLEDSSEKSKYQIELKFTLVEGKNGLFVSWKGQEKYTDKEGKTKYSSPIVIRDPEFAKEVNESVIAEYNSKK